MAMTAVDNNPKKDIQVQRIILIEGAVNIIVLIAKLIVGLTTGSLAILGDAIHSSTDVINNIFAWLVIRVSSSPPDLEHPYGHRKFEILAVFFLASLLTVLAFELALHAITKSDTAIVSAGWSLVVMLAVLAINISLAAWQRIWAKRLQSHILQADASHTFADVLTTIVVIVGWQLSAMGYFWLDRICALAMSMLILWLAYGLYKRAFPVLLDGFSLDPELLASAAQEVEGVIQVYRVRSRWIGDDKSVDLIISVDPDITANDSHEIANNVESLIASRFAVSDILIHIEPHHCKS